MDTTTTTTQLAAQIWATFDDNERFGVRFGLFPAEKMTALDALDRDDHHAVTCALMRLNTAMPAPPPKPRRLTKVEKLLAKYRERVT